DARARLGEVVALVDRPTEVRGETVGPELDRLEVLLRRAQQSGYYRRRKREGELPDEVHRAAGDDAVEERIGGPLDAIAAGLELLRGERALQEAPQPVMVGRIAEHEPAAPHGAHRPPHRPGPPLPVLAPSQP